MQLMEGKIREKNGFPEQTKVQKSPYWMELFLYDICLKLVSGGQKSVNKVFFWNEDEGNTS